MGFTIVKIKVMPALPDIDLELIKKHINSLLKKHQVEHSNFAEENIAFGLKAIILTFEWPEEKELEPFEEAIRKSELISSAEVIDMRRALG